MCMKNGFEPLAIYNIINQLEYELSDKRGLFGKKIDIDKCYQLVLELKNNIPDTIKNAQQLLQHRDKLLKNADNIAQTMLLEAEQNIAQMVDNAKLKKRAEIESQKIIADAYKKSDSIMDTTKKHIDNIFANTETYLQSLTAKRKFSRTTKSVVLS